jgi:hypothetical protein
MSHCSRLIQNYQRFVRLPWAGHLAGKQRVWFAVYPPSEERRVRARIQEFQVATIDAGHSWHLVDITRLPAQYLSDNPDRDGYFTSPSALEMVEEEIRGRVIDALRAALAVPDIDENSVVAVQGIGALFGYTHVSSVISGVEDSIRGRLLVYFPGEYERNQYRFMDARDGFNYMAIPITSNESVLSP